MAAPADPTIYKDISEVILTSSTHMKIICGAAVGQVWDGAFVTSCLLGILLCAVNPAEEEDDFVRI